MVGVYARIGSLGLWINRRVMSADTQAAHPELFEGLPTRWKHHTASARFRMETLVIIALAGAGAQRILADRVFDPAHTHHEEQIAANVVRPFARSEGEAAAYLAWLKVRAEDLLRERWAAVETVADLILQRRH
jgi:hypothetical protein